MSRDTFKAKGTPRHQMTSSELFSALVESLRNDGCDLTDVGDHEIATAIADALDHYGCRSALTEDDNETIARAFECIAELLGA